jgi:hypothetical protein
MIDSLLEDNISNKHIDCRNPSLGLMTKARACESAGQE